MTVYQRNVFGVEIEQVKPVGMQAQAAALGDMADATQAVGQRALEIGQREYVSSLQKAAQEELQKAFEETPADPEALQKKYEAVKASLVTGSTIFPHLQRAGGEVFDRMAAPFVQRARDNFTVQQVETDKLTTMQNVDMLINEITSNAALAYRADGTLDMDAFDRIAQATEQIEQETSRVGINGRPLFSAERRAAYLNEGVERTAQAAIEGMIGNGRSATQLLSEWESTGVQYQAVVDGEDVTISLKEAVSPEGRDRIQRFLEVRSAEEIRQFEKQQKEMQAQEAAQIELMRGEMIASGLIPLNPENKEQRDAFNRYYDEVFTAQLSQMPPEMANQEIVDFVGRTKFFPKTLKGDIKRAARARDPQAVANTADLIDRFRMTGNDHLLTDIADEDLARIDLFNKQIEAGYGAEQAISYVEKTLNYGNKQLTEARTAALSDKKIDYDKEAKNLFESILPLGIGDPEMDSELVQADMTRLASEYEQAFRRQFVLTGSEDSAAEYAASKVRGKYGVTKVNGFKQVMPHSPDKYYAVDGKADYVREQVIEEARKLVGDSLTGFDPDSVMITYDPFVTERTAAMGQPKYAIIYMREDGQLVNLTNNPVYGTEGMFFMPDMQAEKQRYLDEAKKKSDFKQKLEQKLREVNPDAFN